jgi:hypothetical protein
MDVHRGKPDEEGKKFKRMPRHTPGHSRRVVSSSCTFPDCINDQVKQGRSPYVQNPRDDGTGPIPFSDHLDLDFNHYASPGPSDSKATGPDYEAAPSRGLNWDRVLIIYFIAVHGHLTHRTIGNSFHQLTASRKVVPWMVYYMRTRLDRTLSHWGRRERKIHQ